MYRFSRLTSVVLALSTLFVFGCGQTTQNIWDTTKGYYTEYLNPPAQVDFGKECFTNPQEHQFADAFIDMDVQIYNLERTLESAKRPEQAWVENLLQEYPWLAGAAAVDTQGNVVARIPSYDIKNIDYTSILREDKKQHARDLRGSVVQTALGPEILLAVPLYESSQFMGLFSVHFDLRDLLAYSASPADIVVLSESEILWPGRYSIPTTPLNGVDWKKLLKEECFGSVSNENGTFSWVSRYVGGVPLVFAMATEGSFPENPEQLRTISSIKTVR